MFSTRIKHERPALFLNDSDRSFVAQAMRIAAERYEADVKAMNDMAAEAPGNRAWEGLAMQFHGQAAEARRFADDIENAELCVLAPGADDD